MIQLTYKKYPSVSDTFRCGVYYNCIPTSTPDFTDYNLYYPPITSKPKPKPSIPITKYPWAIRTTENPIYVLDPHDHYHENVYNNTADVQTIIRSDKKAPPCDQGFFLKEYLTLLTANGEAIRS